ncbi:LAME_0E10044g1_1 [Lachancea meyersii CBS 8951]|uniref:LAME_0E10044g1_1 n=1 Tax=Lachancea meyersii CBS 8951 TaxID=1266667 RepID=A0A1G4JJX2_9SACH|nr:LAME_0E10044g1_1 [Lachancea meyersii CBS 8951]
MEKPLQTQETLRSPRKAIEERSLKNGVRLRQNLFVDAAPEGKDLVGAVFPDAAVYRGYDELLWGYFIIAVYKDPSTSKLNSLIVDKLGTTYFDAVNTSRKSRFYPAIENLSPQNINSSVRKCIAVSLLQKFADLKPEITQKLQPHMKYDYDPTTAGDLANNCELIGFCSPADVGKSLDRLGFLQDHHINSFLLDVVYEQKPSAIDANNELVFHLGDQLEQLFDPLAEYSPEQTEIIYKPPEDHTNLEKDDPMVSSVCNELLQVQTKFTLSLVEFLQKFLIPLRIEVANDEIDGLSIPKLNRLFPPTIDEVTRINCIFLDALKASSSYGSQEVLNACSITIPYFYKAYTRHEAATKSFSKHIRPFMAKFQDKLPSRDIYSRLKMETIIKSPQEIVLKMKLILDRLWSNKRWAPENAELAEARYSTTCDIIDSFGADERPLSTYSARVFTPSGKLLTELAKGWPTELQYNWLKRRVVGVFDVMDSNDNTQRNILVIFSDYIVVLNVIDTGSYYDNFAAKKPLLSDVLMNSLINEVPLPPKVPKLQVANFFYIDNVIASTFGKDMIRIDHVEPSNASAVAFKIISSSLTGSDVVDLIVKAKVLEKETAFHLFRYVDEDLQIFSTAHEMSAYSTESIRSKFCLFLNIDPSPNFLHENNLVAVFFATLKPNGCVTITELTCEGSEKRFTVELHGLVQVLFSEIKTLYTKFYSTAHSPFLTQLLEINGQLVKRVGHHFNEDLEVASAYQMGNASFIAASHSTCSRSRSLTTATTFRSSTSNLQQESPTKKDQVIKHRGEVVETKYEKNQTVKERDRKTGGVSSRKRRSFMGKISRLFGKKDSKQNEITTKTPKRAPKAKLPTPSSIKERSQVTGRGGTQRMSSIVHKPLTMQKSKERNSLLSDVTSSRVPSTELLSSNNAEKTTTSRRPPSVLDHVPGVNLNSELNGQKIYKLDGEERESRLFNQDLYGDDFDVEKDDTQVSVNAGRQNEKLEAFVENRQSDNISSNKEDSLLVGRGLNANTLQDIQNRNLDLVQDHEQLSSQADEEGRNKNPTEESKQKRKIFPEVKRLIVQNSQFERSPSFREFFENMRLVLDDSDEASNWKRLPSDTSLKTKQRSFNKKPDTHAFKDLVPLNRYPSEHGIAQSQGTHDMDESSTPQSKGPDINDKPPNSTGHDEANTQTDISGNAKVVNKIAEALANNRNNTAGFKVIKHSPSKTVNFDAKSSSLPPEEPAIQLIGERDSVLQVPTTRNVLGDSNSQANGPEKSAGYEHDKKGGLILEELTDAKQRVAPTLTGNNSSKADVSGAVISRRDSATQEQLLDDPDFSSFHITFSDSEETQDLARYDQPTTLWTRTVLGQSPELEPVFYRLPAIERSNETFFTCTDGDIGKSGLARRAGRPIENEDADEALWISPSKLDMFDLSKQPENVFAQISLKNKRIPIKEACSPNLTNLADDKDLLPDFSYAYLGGLLMHDGDDNVDEEDDDVNSAGEPTRLRFYG